MATDDNIMQRMRVKYWIAKVTNTHSEYAILLGNSGYANAFQCYVIRTSPVLCMSKTVHAKFEDCTVVTLRVLVFMVYVSVCQVWLVLYQNFGAPCDQLMSFYQAMRVIQSMTI